MLAPWKKSYDKLRQHIKKQWHYFADKVLSSQSYGFSSSYVWMWELDYKESWASKNWCFELWYWRRLFRVSWTVRRSNQLILKEINPEYSLVGLMLKLKIQHFGHLMQRANSLEKTLMLGKIEGRRRRGRQRTEDEMVGWHHWHDGHEFEQAPGVGNGQGRLVCCSLWSQSWTQLSDWTELLDHYIKRILYYVSFVSHLFCPICRENLERHWVEGRSYYTD